ncbi:MULTISPECIES: gluconokinase [unclassified Clostridium]|uniref:gluconokinase n=1 Tax=Clostridium TaxID=1485 RepID=UPI0013C66352|nr:MULTISPECIES: gluconokinase [unclassified Clostridium]NFI94819.1 gluconokinase [Clostridium botulinum]NFO92807.1 gluconokinase [Clostridium botulinum]
MKYLIGVDIGTTSTKSIAFDMEGNVLTKCNIEYPLYNPHPSWSEQNPEEIFRAVLNGIKHVVQENDIKNNKLLGISFSSAMHSVIAIDKAGNPLTNCIIWADTRSNKYSDELKNSDIGQEIYMRTGTPIHPMSPLCKLCWLRDNAKDVFNNTEKFISIKEYVFYKLFNQYIVDYSIASATGIFDIYDLKWNKKALEYIGISEEKLSKPVPTTYVINGLSDIYAEYMKISTETNFIVGGSDGCLANLGANAIKDGDAAVTIGTSGAIRVISKNPKNDISRRIFSYILTEEHYVLGGAVNNGGIIYRWFRDNFSSVETDAAKSLNIDPYDILNLEASKVKPGAEGLIFLPYLLGERAPHWDANSKGVFFGVNIKHKREHFLRSVLEGVMYGIYDVGKALEETTGPINTIYATGGFVRSELWVQILADIFNKKVVIAESYESSCLGAAIIAMKALNMINDIEKIESLIPISKVFEPNIENHKVYIENFKIYKKLYEKLKDEFLEINNLQD